MGVDEIQNFPTINDEIQNKASLTKNDHPKRIFKNLHHEHIIFPLFITIFKHKKL